MKAFVFFLLGFFFLLVFVLRMNTLTGYFAIDPSSSVPDIRIVPKADCSNEYCLIGLYSPSYNSLGESLGSFTGACDDPDIHLKVCINNPHNVNKACTSDNLLFNVYSFTGYSNYHTGKNTEIYSGLLNICHSDLSVVYNNGPCSGLGSEYACMFRLWNNPETRPVTFVEPCARSSPAIDPGYSTYACVKFSGTAPQDAVYVNSCGGYGSATEVNTTYILTDDLIASGDCISILGEDNTFDCNGHTITGDGIGKGINLELGGRSTVKNCRISYFQYAVYASTTGYHHILNNNLLNSVFGFYSAFSHNNVFEMNRACSNSNKDLYCTSSSNTLGSGNSLDNRYSWNCNNWPAETDYVSCASANSEMKCGEIFGTDDSTPLGVFACNNIRPIPTVTVNCAVPNSCVDDDGVCYTEDFDSSTIEWNDDVYGINTCSKGVWCPDGFVYDTRSDGCIFGRDACYDPLGTQCKYLQHTPEWWNDAYDTETKDCFWDTDTDGDIDKCCCEKYVYGDGSNPLAAFYEYQDIGVLR